MSILVIHRVGGLEDHNCQGSHQHNVIHRVGGLEVKKVSIGMLCECEKSPLGLRREGDFFVLSTVSKRRAVGEPSIPPPLPKILCLSYFRGRAPQLRRQLPTFPLALVRSCFSPARHGDGDGEGLYFFQRRAGIKPIFQRLPLPDD